MKKKIQKAVESYQCCGCIFGCDISCFKNNDVGGVGCGMHVAGTHIAPFTGKVFLGLPKGFNRLGKDNDLKPIIFETYDDLTKEWEYDKFNIAVWKYLDENENTIVRGIMPRLNETFIHIILENCIDKINCLEITDQDINEMD